jgi:hypothetical protein
MSVVVPNSVAAMGLQAAALRKRIAAQILAQRQRAALAAQTQGVAAPGLGVAPDPMALQQAQLAQQQQAAQQAQMQQAAEEDAQRKLALQQQMGGA